MPAAIVAGRVREALSRRYADLMWTARTRDGAAQVVILTEFQGRQDRVMPLWTTIYSLLAVQELLRRTRPPPHPETIEVLQPVVMLDAEGPWRGPTGDNSMDAAHSTDSDHLFRQNDHRFQRIPITPGEAEVRGGAGGSGCGVEV